MANGTLNNETPMVKHISSILQSVIILLLVYFGSNVVDNGKAIAVINTKLDVVVKSNGDHAVRIRALELDE